jgi:hypothetical protein
MRTAIRILVEIPERNRPLRRTRDRWENNVKIELKRKN